MNPDEPLLNPVTRADSDAHRARQMARARVTAVLLLGFAVLVFAIALVRIAAGARPV